MTVSIRQSLAMLPDGQPGEPLSFDELGPFLRDKLKLDSDDEKARNERHALRDRVYADGGAEDMCVLLDEMFDPKIAAKLKKRIKLANFSNPVKRIVGELSTVYARPARRTVADKGAQAKLDAVVSALDLDAQLSYANAMLNLHRALLVGPRVRKNADGSRTLVLDIATPSIARAIPNPLDTTQILAWLIRVDMPIARLPDAYAGKRPAWMLWSDHEQGYLDERLIPIPASWIEHGLKINRWVPLTYSANAVPRFWPGHEGEDLIAAFRTMLLCAVLMIKETQATTRVPVATGDLSNAARGQAAESDGMVNLPEGAALTTVEIGTDPGVFITASNNALERTGNNYGLSMGALTHQGTQSAEARDLLLAPVRERRGRQVHIMHRFEAALIKVIARVLAVDLPGEAFDPAGFRINFAEAQTLQSARERLDLFERRRTNGLTNTVDFLMDEDPDLDEATAWSVLTRNVEVETQRRVLMNDLIAASGSMGQMVPDAPAPAENPQRGVPQGPVAERGDDDLAWVEEAMRDAA